MKIKDLPRRVTASKADLFPQTDCILFTPSRDNESSRSKCVETIRRQSDGGYIIEYITKGFPKPNPAYKNYPGYLDEVEEHNKYAGCFTAIHRLEYTACHLKNIRGEGKYNTLQDRMAKDGKRWRWSVALPVVESFEIVGQPKAKDVLGDSSYHRLFARSSATLRPLKDEERAALVDLELRPRQTRSG